MIVISVIMPVYNAAPFLKRTVESVLNQSFTNFEFIIINDGSVDNSEEIILSFNDPRIVYERKENGGEASARNLGLSLAKREYIVFQDADDLSTPNRFEEMLTGFKNPSIGIVHSDMLVVDQNDSPIGYLKTTTIEKQNVKRFILKTGTPFNNASMMTRREVFSNLRYDTSVKIGPDTLMTFQIAQKWDNVHIPKPLYYYRQHNNNITKQSDYETGALHMRKILDLIPLKEWVPEVNWENGQDEENESIAHSIIAYHLFKRGLTVDAHTYLKKASNLSDSNEAKLFLMAIIKLMQKDIPSSLNCLEAFTNKNHIVLNFIGETYAYSGKINEAAEFFLRALNLNPLYEDALDNLTGLGGLNNFCLVDSRWIKFRR